MDMNEPANQVSGNSVIRIGVPYCAAVSRDTHEPFSPEINKLGHAYYGLYGFRHSDEFEFEASNDG